MSFSMATPGRQPAIRDETGGVFTDLAPISPSRASEIVAALLHVHDYLPFRDALC